MVGSVQAGVDAFEIVNELQSHTLPQFCAYLVYAL